MKTKTSYVELVLSCNYKKKMPLSQAAFSKF